MKIGVSLSNSGFLPSRSFLKDTALEIERLELDSIWVSDHIMFRGMTLRGIEFLRVL